VRRARLGPRLLILAGKIDTVTVLM